MRLKITLFASSLAVAATLAACGDDEPATTTPIDTGATGATGVAGPITPEELIDEGDPICAEAYVALASTATNAPGSQQAAIVEGMLEGLQSLGDPGSENRDDLDSFYDSLKEAQKAYKKDDTDAADTALSEARAAASDYGFDECGKRGDSITNDSGTGSGAGTSGTDTGGVDSVEPVAPAPTEPAPVEPVEPAPPAGGTGEVPPTDSGGGTGSGDTGGTSGNSGGVSP